MEDKYSQQRVILAAFLADMRKGSGKSQIELAQTLGLTEQIIEEWESGERHIDISELRAYCQAIDLPLADCIAFLEKMFSQISDS